MESRDDGWECPQILCEMKTVGDIYFDRVSRIRMDRWTSGRTALAGDAAVSLLAGEGTGLASSFVPRTSVGLTYRHPRAIVCSGLRQPDPPARHRVRDSGFPECDRMTR